MLYRLRESVVVFEFGGWVRINPEVGSHGFYPRIQEYGDQSV